MVSRNKNNIEMAGWIDVYDPTAYGLRPVGVVEPSGFLPTDLQAI